MKINAAEFKAKCLKLIDEVAATRKPLIITKRGRPVASVVPIVNAAPQKMFGYMKGTGEIVGDIVKVPRQLGPQKRAKTAICIETSCRNPARTARPPGPVRPANETGSPAARYARLAMALIRGSRPPEAWHTQIA